MSNCPNCNATHDYHPDPGGPNGETWRVCEHCGYTKDHHGLVIDPGRQVRLVDDEEDL